MDNFEDYETKRTLEHDETRDAPFTNPSGTKNGIAFLVGAVLVILAIVVYGSWTGSKNPSGPSTTTIEQPAQPTPIKPLPAPG